jgi:hypothetical protein
MDSQSTTNALSIGGNSPNTKLLQGSSREEHPAIIILHASSCKDHAALRTIRGRSAEYSRRETVDINEKARQRAGLAARDATRTYLVTEALFT